MASFKIVSRNLRCSTLPIAQVVEHVRVLARGGGLAGGVWACGESSGDTYPKAPDADYFTVWMSSKLSGRSHVFEADLEQCFPVLRPSSLLLGG